MAAVSKTERAEALSEVISLMRRHGITPEELTAALAGAREVKEEASSGILSRLFGYVGGLLVFAGLAIFVDMRWSDLDAIGRISVTLGPGFCAFLMALTCLTRPALEKAATPLFLVAALLEPTGMMVAMQEYAHGGRPAAGILFMCLVMALQQGCAFWAKRRTVLAFTTIVFCGGFYGAACELLEVPETLAGLTLGASLCCVAWSLSKSRHSALSWFWYFVGSVSFLCAAWDWLHRSAAEVLFLGLACGTIFLATVARSRALLIVGTLSMLGYIGYFIDEHFAHDLGAPVALMLAGFLLIGFGALAVKINNKYIRQKG
jgi:hypothetical protein